MSHWRMLPRRNPRLPALVVFVASSPRALLPSIPTTRKQREIPRNLPPFLVARIAREKAKLRLLPQMSPRLRRVNLGLRRATFPLVVLILFAKQLLVPSPRWTYQGRRIFSTWRFRPLPLGPSTTRTILFLRGGQLLHHLHHQYNLPLLRGGQLLHHQYNLLWLL